MRRIVHGVLAVMLIVGNVSAKTYTDKTFLMPRSHGMNMAMEYTTWHKQMALIDKDKFGATIQATGFYEKSNNKKELGKYFGVCNYNNANCIQDFLVVEPHDRNDTINPQPVHLLGWDIFHSHELPGGHFERLTLADKLCWRPYRESYGLRLDYHQKLDKLVNGLYFKVSMPIVHVKTSMGWTSSCGKPCGDTTTNTDCNDPCKSATNYCTKQGLEDNAGALSSTTYSVADYLTGCVKNDATENKQVALCKARIHNGNNETGIADIDLILGYNFLYKPTRHINANIGLTVPLGNKPNGDYLWEAIVGNAGHWAIGLGVDSAFQLWKDEDMSLDFIFGFNYRYLLRGTEKRTMGFRYPQGTDQDDGVLRTAGKHAMYGHWLLGAKIGDTFATPLAHYLTRDLSVDPGSHFDGIVQMAFNWKKFTFDGGYNLFWKQAETVRLKDDICAGACGSGCGTSGCNTDCTPAGGWEDDTYGIPSTTWNTTNAFVATLALDDALIKKTDLDLCTCSQESVVTHKLYGGVGYEFDEWDYPLILGLGGSYEWATDNDCLEAWSFWAKVGITF